MANNETTLNESHRMFLARIALDCIQNKVTLHLGRDRRVRLYPDTANESLSQGYFDEEGRVLAVAIADWPVERWFGVLLHEWSHMQQWKEGLYCDDDFTDRFNIHSEWIHEGVDGFTEEQLDDSFAAAVACELDCEKRTVRLLNENLRLGIDPERYIQQANAYMYFYYACRVKRAWYKKNPPTRVDKIVDKMPMKFLPQYKYVDTPVRLMALFEKECFAEE